MYTYEELKGFVDHCRRCPLSGTRNKAVMGQGNLSSGILFIAGLRELMRIVTAFPLRDRQGVCLTSS